MKKTIESTTTTTTTMKRRPWEDLPHHILELFLKPISEPIDRPNLSRVCKSWQDFKPPQSSCFPELVHGSIIFNRVLRGDEFDEYLLRSCVGSSHGWLIIRMRRINKDEYVHPKELYYLLNIFTNDTIQLPLMLLNVTPVFPKCYLSSAPTDPDCIILMFDVSFRGFLFSKRGCNKWIESECEYPLYSKPADSKDYIYTAAPLGGGKFYALSYRGNLVAIDIINVSTLLQDHHPTAAAEANTTLTVVPVNSFYPTRPIRVGYDWFLIESLGKLLLVILYRRETDREIVNLDVLELDFETMSWVTMKSLPGDQMLFIGLCGSFSISGSEIGISSSSGRGGNCIYVIDDVFGKVHMYDVHNQEMMLCTGFPTCEAFETYTMFWVMLRPGIPYYIYCEAVAGMHPQLYKSLRRIFFAAMKIPIQTDYYKYSKIDEFVILKINHPYLKKDSSINGLVVDNIESAGIGLVARCDAAIFRGARTLHNLVQSAEEGEALAALEAVKWAGCFNTNWSFERDNQSVMKALQRNNQKISWRSNMLIKECFTRTLAADAADRISTVLYNPRSTNIVADCLSKTISNDMSI